jgi:hypothetical protein
MPHGVVDRFDALSCPLSQAQLLGDYRVLSHNCFLRSFLKLDRLFPEEAARGSVRT